jgi:hypothetical protein
MVLDDEKGNERIGLEITNDNPGVDLYDEKGNTRAVLGRAPLETVRTGATEVTAPSSLTLFNKEGNVIWRAP